VVGGIVRSSSISAVVMTGLAGRAICCGGGISISGGSSIASSNVSSNEKSSAVSSGQKANVARCKTVDAIIAAQSRELNVRRRRSFAVSRDLADATSAVMVSPYVVGPSE